MSQIRVHQLSFLDLPAEIRLNIYSHCFGFEEIRIPRRGHGQPSRGVTLLRTCRLIHTEALPVFYNQTSIMVNGKSVQPFPATIDRHLKGSVARLLLKEIVIADPRAMPYRYGSGGYPKRKNPIDFRFSLLRYLPSVRNLIFTDLNPVPIQLMGSNEHCETTIPALEAYFCAQLGRTLELLGDPAIQSYAAVNVFASATIDFTRPPICTVSHDMNSDESLEAHACKWLLPKHGTGCSGRAEMKVKLHPVRDIVMFGSHDEEVARRVLVRHIQLDDWFFVRNV